MVKARTSTSLSLTAFAVLIAWRRWIRFGGKQPPNLAFHVTSSNQSERFSGFALANNFWSSPLGMTVPRRSPLTQHSWHWEPSASASTPRRSHVDDNPAVVTEVAFAVNGRSRDDCIAKA